MGSSTRIRARLAGRRVMLTGVTGFVGQAVLYLLLERVPDVSVVLLVRPKDSAGGEARVRALLGRPVFGAVAEAAGGPDVLMRRRITVLEGDLDAVPELPADLDAVVHCAGDVSFDPPVDEAFRTNVVGTRNLLDRVGELGSNVHYVHVSTAYVAGRRRGTLAEGPIDHQVDLATELAWGLAQRQQVEDRSRTPEVLGRIRARAEREHRRAGPMTAATAAEEKRRAWVSQELVGLGRERARSLGWTDCYTFTKALGERLVEAHARTAPTTVVRPSVIESALRTPHPGWIEGFKMAEPLILAYGRGELPEFPASPDSVVDIVPVDHVAAAVTATLARPPAPGQPRWLHVCSGARNPLSFARLYGNVRAYFERHPFETGTTGAARLPEWRLPGAPTVERLLVTSERAHRAADYVVSHVPRSDRSRDLARRLDRQRARLEFLRRYLDLYLEYATAELRFADDNTLALHASLAVEDREDFGFDTAVIDWEHYLREVHCPAVADPIRRLDSARAGRRRAGNPAPAKLDRGDADVVAAVFDMDGTLLSSNVIETYLWMRLPELDPSERLGEVARMAARLPALVRAERVERSGFLRRVYRKYAGARLADLDAIADEVLSQHVLSRLAPQAVRRIREHRRAGHRTVLLTGAIRPLTRPLAPLFDHVEAAELDVDDRGVCTGSLKGPPLVGESRAAWLRHWADQQGIDLAASYAYADSHSDLPLLRTVGNPVVVRPDVPLLRHARMNRWPVVDWASPAASARPLNPAGSRS